MALHCLLFTESYNVISSIYGYAIHFRGHKVANSVEFINSIKCIDINAVIFREELRTKLSEDPASINDYNYFQNILYEVLNKHAPQKKKYLRANDSPFMTKHLRKMIMNRSPSKNAYIKNKTIDNWEKLSNTSKQMCQRK